MSNIYQFKAITNRGEEISLDQYKGKVLLIVNTASKCGFTPQYDGLQELYEKFGPEKFVILGFPCNQFANQEPGTDEEIAEFCKINFGVTFPLFQKVEVNGPDTHPLFEYLKRTLRGPLGKKIKWNFTKFLIDAEGQPIKRFGPSVKPSAIEAKIRPLIDARAE